MGTARDFTHVAGAKRVIRPQVAAQRQVAVKAPIAVGAGAHLGGQAAAVVGAHVNAFPPAVHSPHNFPVLVARHVVVIEPRVPTHGHFCDRAVGTVLDP